MIASPPVWYNFTRNRCTERCSVC